MRTDSISRVDTRSVPCSATKYLFKTGLSHTPVATFNPAYEIAPKRGRSLDEQRAISGSLSLLSNLVMAWNTQKIQELVDKPDRHNPVIGMDDISLVDPVATSHINFRAVLNFPIEEFSEPILRDPVAFRTGR